MRPCRGRWRSTRKAREHFERAARLARTLGRFDEALQLNRRAASADPLSPRSWGNLSIVATSAGKLDEALSAATKGLELQPGRPGLGWSRGRVYLAQERPQEALTEFQQEVEPAWRLFGLALAYHALGRKQESDQALAELIDKFAANFAFQVSQVYAFRREADRAFEWLERAYAQRDGGLPEIKGDFFLKNLHSGSALHRVPEEDAPARVILVTAAENVQRSARHALRAPLWPRYRQSPRRRPASYGN